MNQETRRSVVASLLSVVVGVAITWAGSQHGRLVAGIPVFALCAVLAFAINWIVFVPAYLLQTERYFDLAGSFTYVALIAVALRATESPSPRALLLRLPPCRVPLRVRHRPAAIQGPRMARERAQRPARGAA